MELEALRRFQPIVHLLSNEKSYISSIFVQRYIYLFICKYIDDELSFDDLDFANYLGHLFLF